MPKDIVQRKAKGNVYRDKPIGRKLKIGSRKAGKPGHTLSNADLLAVLENADKKRYHANARTVLVSRGVTV
jgi:hypothetical protein